MLNRSLLYLPLSFSARSIPLFSYTYKS